MGCELLDCCQFFKETMQGMPKTAEYIKNRLCFGNYEACNRYRIYEEFGKSSIPSDLDPDDAEQVRKILKCLREKHEETKCSPESY